MTSQGSPHGRFQRAIERRHVFQAEIAARELGFLSLQNALALVVLYAQEDSPKFESAAVRWMARLALEGKGIRLADLHLAAGALSSLRGLRRERAEKALLSVCYERRLRNGVNGPAGEVVRMGLPEAGPVSSGW